MKIKNLQTRFIFLFVCVIFTSIAHAQQNIIAGTVTDEESGQPLEDVEIILQKTGMHTHTDELGKYTLQSTDQNADVSFIKIGYHSKDIRITMAAGVTKNIDVKLKSKSATLGAVDISTDKPVSAASSKYLSAVDFENRPKNSAQDMLRLVPGLFIAQHAGGGKAEQIFIRGFDCDHGTDVATFVDGMPVNMPSHGHGQGYEDLHFLIPEIVKGMDIFKGPYSPKYGDFATGAAVQFNTLDSLDKNTIQIESAYVPDQQNISATRGLALLKMPDLGSNITSYFAADIVGNRGYFESAQHFKRFSLFSKTTFAVTDHSHIHFSAGGFGSSWDASGQVPERAIKSGEISRFGSIDNSEGGTTQRNNFNLIYHTQIEGTEFETQVYSVDYRFKLFSNFTFFLNDPINGDEIEQDDNRSVKGFNAHYTFSHMLGNMNDRFTVGISYRNDNIENQLWHVAKRSRLEARAQANIQERSTGIYLNEVFRFSDQFRIEAGLRFDYFIFDVDDLLPTDSNHTNYSGFNYQSLVSPKLNMIYSVNDKTQFFANAAIGYHSNDARSVVQDLDNHTLPIAIGAEVGTLVHFGNNVTASAALWWLDLTNELVYVGDDGTTEDKGPSRRTGIDLSMRVKLNSWLYLDADLNLAKNVFIDTLFGKQLNHDYYLPLAPALSSAGGLTAHFNNSLEAGLRYRFLAERPANETNTVKTRGYNIIDFSTSYQTKKYKVGFAIENLLNTEWNEAQFDTESRLFNETNSVDELHFTPGTPFSAKITLAYFF